MAQCKKCGISVDDQNRRTVKGVIFCESCYDKLRQEYLRMKSVSEKAPSLTCESCGEVSPAGSLHCKNCGAFLLKNELKEQPEVKKPVPAPVKEVPPPRPVSVEKVRKPNLVNSAGKNNRIALTLRAKLIITAVIIVVFFGGTYIIDHYVMPELSYFNMIRKVHNIKPTTIQKVRRDITDYVIKYPITPHGNAINNIRALIDEYELATKNIQRVEKLRENHDLLVTRLATVENWYFTGKNYFVIIEGAFDKENGRLNESGNEFLKDWSLHRSEYVKIIDDLKSEQFDLETDLLHPDFANVIDDLKGYFIFEEILANTMTLGKTPTEEELRYIIVNYDLLIRELSDGNSEEILTKAKADLDDLNATMKNAENAQLVILDKIIKVR